VHWISFYKLLPNGKARQHFIVDFLISMREPPPNTTTSRNRDVDGNDRARKTLAALVKFQYRGAPAFLKALLSEKVPPRVRDAFRTAIQEPAAYYNTESAMPMLYEVLFDAATAPALSPESCDTIADLVEVLTEDPANELVFNGRIQLDRQQIEWRRADRVNRPSSVASYDYEFPIVCDFLKSVTLKRPLEITAYQFAELLTMGLQSDREALEDPDENDYETDNWLQGHDDSFDYTESFSSDNKWSDDGMRAFERRRQHDKNGITLSERVALLQKLKEQIRSSGKNCKSKTFNLQQNPSPGSLHSDATVPPVLCKYFDVEDSDTIGEWEQVKIDALEKFRSETECKCEFRLGGLAAAANGSRTLEVIPSDGKSSHDTLFKQKICPGRTREYCNIQTTESYVLADLGTGGKVEESIPGGGEERAAMHI